MGKGYGTRAHPLGLNLMSTHSLGHQYSGFGFATPSRQAENTWTHFQLGEKELLSSSLHKTLSKLERKISAKVYCVAEDCSATLVEIANELGDLPFGQVIAFSVLPSAFSHFGSLGGTILLCETDRQLADCSFPHLLIHFLQGFAYWNEGPICFILRLSVYASTKTSNT
ncbi:hypothetical protein H5410_002376 [Solanum commersonii]|uniref:Uncharacterized protein n=1 Tax=Solanum commersonii TaxID=4109 RepID=A0A9J6B252_SOLCO|nr:hypothetical protein H5410_002376 [Solanum commersonii]